MRIDNLGNYQNQVSARLTLWEKTNFIRRLLKKDHTLWSKKQVSELTDRLGWLTLPELMHRQLDEIVCFAEEAKSEGIRYIVLLGMGGSILAPKIFKNIFGSISDYPILHVLDSTHPSAITEVEKKISLDKTLFLISSKSGRTLETLSLFRYFWKKMKRTIPDQGDHFVAITDSNTPLTKRAMELGFRRIFNAPHDVGGRYSALTVFGLVPAALMGVKVDQLLDQSWIMSKNFASHVSSDKISCLRLGAVLGELGTNGRDKATFITSSSLESFPLWIEQLIAESTCKDGKGIIPIVDEPQGTPEQYGNDRFFIYLFHEQDNTIQLDNHIKRLESAGNLIIRFCLPDKSNIGQEIFRWEIAVAAAGSILGINPFNQPNVELSKQLARVEMKKISKQTTLRDDSDAIIIKNPSQISSAWKRWIGKAQEGNYIALQAYLPPIQEITDMLQAIRLKLFNNTQLATTYGYGPSFLHSTGQLHKGGPNTGLFLQLVDEPIQDLAIPETNYTFGSLIRAQYLGDYQALIKLKRKVLRINLQKNPVAGLKRLLELIDKI